MTHALLLGKFMPLHRGHELMIETAMELFDHVTLIVCTNDEDYPEELTRNERMQLIGMKYEGLNLISAKDEIGDPKETDEYGTALDEGYMDRWADFLWKIYDDMKYDIRGEHFTHFVSSDRYGKELAGAMGIEWLPVDPDRELYPISARQIRANPHAHWQLISEPFRNYYLKTFAIVGPESVGKTTATKKLARHFGGLAVPEYGRFYTDHDKYPDTMGFKYIYAAQQRWIKNAETNTPNGLVFTDTEAATTLLFEKKYNGVSARDEELIHQFIAIQDIDHYFLLKHTVPWVDDGTRTCGSKEDRDWFYTGMVELLAEKGATVTIIDEENYDDRLEHMIRVVKRLGVDFTHESV